MLPILDGVLTVEAIGFVSEQPERIKRKKEAINIFTKFFIPSSRSLTLKFTKNINKLLLYAAV
jgi:hypothetical protein